jgi:hypothetical protein
MSKMKQLYEEIDEDKKEFMMFCASENNIIWENEMNKLFEKIDKGEI